MEEIIDKYLDETIKLGLNRLPGFIEPLMSDKNQEASEEWRIWYPIKSKVTDQEIIDCENVLGFRLPDSYKRFLKYKHFYELLISECSFGKHPVNTWRASLNKIIFDGYPTEFLIEIGRIPFASWSDWGLLCFDTTQKCSNNDYPIVLWDHERYDNFENKYMNFESMIYELDLEENK